MATDIKTLQQSRDLLSEIDGQIESIERGYEKASWSQRKGLQDYQKILTEVINSEQVSNREVAKRADLIQKLASGSMGLKDIAAERARIQKSMTSGKVKEGGAAHKGYQMDMKMLDTAEKRANTQETLNIGMDELNRLTGGQAEGAEEVLGAMSGQLTKAGLIGIALKAVVSILMTWNQRMDEIGAAFGAVGLQSKEIKNDMLEASQNVATIGRNMGDVIEATTTLTNEFNVGWNEAREMSDEVVNMGVALGIGTNEAAKFIGQWDNILGFSRETAESFAKHVTLLAKANNVAPQAVIRDMASNTEAIALFTDKTGKNIAEATIHARQLKVEFGTIADSARSLLNWQDTLNNALEASVLLGTEIDTSQLMKLSLANDLTGVMDEQRRLLIQMNFLDMDNAIHKEAAAKAVGLSVKDAMAIVSEQEKAVTLAGELAGQPGFDELIGEAGISTLAQLAGQFKRLGALMVNGLGPALNSLLRLINGIVGAINLLLEATGLNSLFRWMGGQDANYTKNVNAAWDMMMGEGSYSDEALGGDYNPNAPGYANGGIVPATPGGKRITVGEGNSAEAVIPLNQMGGSDEIVSAIESLKSEMTSMKDALASLKLNTKITNKQLDIVLSPTLSG